MGSAPCQAKSEVLTRLFAVIEARAGASAKDSYTAALLAGGRERIARKLGEESLETMIAGLTGTRESLIDESADLLYHLLVLWAARGVRPDEVWQALAAREGVSGHAEKAARAKGRTE